MSHHVTCESPPILPVLACPQWWGSPPFWEAIQLHGVRTDLSKGTMNSEMRGPEGLPSAEASLPPDPCAARSLCPAADRRPLSAGNAESGALGGVRGI